MPGRAALLVLSVVLFAAPSIAQGLPDSAPAVSTTRVGTKVLALPRTSDVWHFVIYGDRTGGKPSGLEILEQAVRDTNLLDPDLVMTVGDLVQGYNTEKLWTEQAAEYKAIMSALRMPWYPVAGNHDVYWRGPGKPETEHDQGFETHFGPLWYSFRHKNAGIVVLYSDETDAETKTKSFGKGASNRFSDRQLAWLKTTLVDLADARHVFVFLHHPRWVEERYPGSNWRTVHELLKNAGNVRAVFAGHIHFMRYDGEKDGIAYHSLAATGADLRADVPKAGFLHHIDVVTVRPDRTTIAALPVGAVIDPRQFVPERVEDVSKLLGMRPLKEESPLAFRGGEPLPRVYSFRMKNPATRPLDGTLSFRGGPRGLTFSPDHQHFVLDAGAETVLSFSYVYDAKTAGDGAFPPLEMAVALDYLGSDLRIALPERLQTIEPVLDLAAESVGAEGLALAFDGTTSHASIASLRLALPQGPMTLEAWVRAEKIEGRAPLASKCENAEYGIFLDDGRPRFIIHLDGRYTDVGARADRRIDDGRWHHVAGVFDGAHARFYLDGALLSEKKAAGKRTVNSLPLVIGADPDRDGRPVDAARLSLRGVRLSKRSRYEGPAIVPEGRLSADEDTLFLLEGPAIRSGFVIDRSGRGAHARLGGGVVLEREESRSAPR